MKIHREICKVTSTFLGFEDHGIFTASIQVDYGNCSQGIGGFVMSTVNENDPNRKAIAKPRAADFIIGILRAFGVHSWEQLKGRTVYALFEGDEMRLNAKPIGFENLPTEDGERFLFADWQRSVKEAM
jgi:hypothetical protein